MKPTIIRTPIYFFSTLFYILMGSLVAHLGTSLIALVILFVIFMSVGTLFDIGVHNKARELYGSEDTKKGRTYIK